MSSWKSLVEMLGREKLKEGGAVRQQPRVYVYSSGFSGIQGPHSGHGPHEGRIAIFL